jgi:hypothetical protein
MSTSLMGDNSPGVTAKKKKTAPKKRKKGKLKRSE